MAAPYRALSRILKVGNVPQRNPAETWQASNYWPYHLAKFYG
jgi:hypothetical protein